MKIDRSACTSHITSYIRRHFVIIRDVICMKVFCVLFDCASQRRTARSQRTSYYWLSFCCFFLFSSLHTIYCFAFYHGDVWTVAVASDRLHSFTLCIHAIGCCGVCGRSTDMPHIFSSYSFHTSSHMRQFPYMKKCITCSVVYDMNTTIYSTQNDVDVPSEGMLLLRQNDTHAYSCE